MAEKSAEDGGGKKPSPACAGSHFVCSEDYKNALDEAMRKANQCVQDSLEETAKNVNEMIEKIKREYDPNICPACPNSKSGGHAPKEGAKQDKEES